MQKLIENVVIGPFCIVGSDAYQIGKSTTLHFPCCREGSNYHRGRWLKFSNLPTLVKSIKILNIKVNQRSLIIGHRNRIRESVTIHRGTVQGGGVTRIGDNLTC